MPNNRDKFNYIQAQSNALDPDTFYAVFFYYYLSWHNLYHSPLLLGSTLLAFFNKKESIVFEGKRYPIHHVCHISRFIPDNDEILGKNQIPELFEASITAGMQRNYYRDKLEAMDGISWIMPLGKVDKVMAKQFELEYLGQPYSKWNAFRAGVDIKILDKLIKLRKGFLCSWLFSIFAKNQGYKMPEDLSEMTPVNVWRWFSQPKIKFYDSKLFK